MVTKTNKAPVAADDLADDLLWGVPAIAAYIGQETRAVHYLIAKGVLPVRRLGHRTLVASKQELRAALAGGERETNDQGGEL